MKRHWLLRKGSAIAVILLCGGLTIVSCLTENISKASAENTEVNITIQICGMKGFRNHTVALPRQQYLELAQYISDLQKQLNKTTTDEEIITIFKEAVVKFHKYGLLPREISVEQAQRLVTGQYQSHHMLFSDPNTLVSKGTIQPNHLLKTSTKNIFCLLFAVATKIPGYIPSPVILPFSILLLIDLLPALIVSILGGKALASALAELGLFVWKANPFRAFNYLLINGYSIQLHSLGLKGIVHETLPTGCIFRGFSGLMLFPFRDTTMFLGFALSVNGD